ncbi:MAG: alpha-amylase family glycosyl hydrolase [Neptuniibacter sp.]
MNSPLDWWKGGVIYQIYPRSFKDSSGDGYGDLCGIIEKLEYVASLGVDGVWLSPFFESPMKDFGYDVSDYRSVDPIFGTLDDFKVLVETAHKLNLKVLIDQVISHSSDQHPWFQESSASRDNPKADWYVWADPEPDGSPPNNWLSIFTGSAWQYHPLRKQYYLHNFLVCQPDMNFHNPDVRKVHLDNMRFWLELGVDGFRLDTVNFYFHDAELRNNPMVLEEAEKNHAIPEVNQYRTQRHIYDLSRPENIPFIKEIRALLDEYPGSTLVGEITDDRALERVAEYTKGSDRLHMAYSFDLLTDRCDVPYLRSVIQKFYTEAPDSWPCWALSNHDVVRSATRWGAQKDPLHYPLIALVMLMSLRGSVCIYQGEELGLTEADITFEDLQDPYGISYWPEYKGRDGCRTPMVWDASKYAGFSVTEPWLPVDESHLGKNVELQNQAKDSLLNKVRGFVKWRSQQPALVKGAIQILENTGEALCWIRTFNDQSIYIAINLTGEAITLTSPKESFLVLQKTGFNGYLHGGDIVLPPYQALFALIQSD